MSPRCEVTPAPHPARPDMAFVQMLERIRYDGAYPTRERAAQALHAVLGALGQQLIGDERVELAARLPHEAARTFASQVPATQPCTGRDFVQGVASRTAGTPATARWDTSAVLLTVARLAGPDLLDRIIAQLPAGYALLFGRRELSHAA
ncbi:DUF2267 domain-containing protein [Streptomyces sp. H39-S7]|uniref:DUF2267 domain-containing protein n=1 Tax=Streptomyces sp. H39-S7 TaxID=3004357 RepID=UPI0022B02647|nr:DUF2267 domain-containing protein [Streptomyces sp. H39-S7]MCZ4123103.1 DUF2267 domain-containing protein [Streptomyces sp. H39-S7]